MSEELQPKETAKAYAAFAEYCALGSGRSLHKLAQKHGENTGKTRGIERQYELWSSQHNWQERVKQYDAEKAEEKRIARELAREAMNDRHAEESRSDQELARKELRTLAEKHRLGSLAAVQLLKVALEAERKAYEDDTPEKVEVSGDVTHRVVFVVPKKRQVENNGDDDITIA